MFATEAKKHLKCKAVPTLFEIPNPPPRIGTKRKLLERKDECIASMCVFFLQNSSPHIDIPVADEMTGDYICDSYKTPWLTHSSGQTHFISIQSVGFLYHTGLFSANKETNIDLNNGIHNTSPFPRSAGD